MPEFSRRAVLAGIGAVGATGLLPGAGRAAALDDLVVHGAPGTSSVALAHLVESGQLSAHVGKARFRVYSSPDELRAGIASGQWKLAQTPTYVAANMYNRGLPVRLLNVMTTGQLYVMARDEGVKTLADLKGRTLGLFFRNDMPDLVFQYVARKQGIDLARDITVHYAATPMEAAQLLLAGKVQAAVLSEPAATAAILQGMQAGVTIHRVLDLRTVWAEATGGKAALPQAGMLVTADLLERHPELVRAVQDGCRRSTEWTRANPASAARLAEDYMGLKAPAIERAIPYSNLASLSAREARPELDRLFSALAELSPAILGGKLPDDGFFLG
jgi:NitT/TauT family transport system substrate-binding protein